MRLSLGRSIDHPKATHVPTTELTRRSILEDLFLRGNISGNLDLVTFLERTWPLKEMPSSDPRFTHAAGDIWQHTVNNHDWDDSYLFYDYLRLPAAPDDVFEKFLVSLVHPLVRQGDEQSQVVQLVNAHLYADGCSLVEKSEISGHPIYEVQHANQGVRRAAKNLIFAANGPKPELVLCDAVSNDVDIVKNAEYCLVYDQQIPASGLLWRDLITWWGARQGQAVEPLDVERNLYSRLLASLHDSPPEQLLFDTYFRRIRDRLGAVLPALIPQVYLHYDPYTVRHRRGKRALPRQRMDFLLLLPRNRRIVLEIDGKHHYADGNAASPQLYAEMVSEDRRLRLAGYEVFRFGGIEVQGESGRDMVERFFLDLFECHGITAASTTPL